MDFWLFIGAVNGFLAVAAGAFAAHALEGRATPADIAIFQTGAHYHLVHALAIVAAGWAARSGSASARHAAWLFLSGIVLFSGSLYILGATGSRALVLVTPVGGVLLLAGWALLAFSAIGRRA